MLLARVAAVEVAHFLLQFLGGIKSYRHDKFTGIFCMLRSSWDEVSSSSRTTTLNIKPNNVQTVRSYSRSRK